MRNDNVSDFRFKRNEHLKGRKEIQEVFGKGKRYSCSGVKLFVLKNNLPYNRICFTFSKATKENRKTWNAVARNRARRLGREAYRLIKNRLLNTNGHDFILLVFPEPLSNKTSLQDRSRQLESLFLKAGLLK